MGAMNQRIELRCTDDEKARIQAEADAAGLALSALIRQRVLDPNPPIISPREVDGGQEVRGGQVIYDDQPPISPEQVAAVPGMRGCEKCGLIVGSPTLRRCVSCNGKIVPPPKGN